MAKWEYEVVTSDNHRYLADQLKSASERDWEPILYQFSAVPGSGTRITELHYVIIRRSLAPQ